MTKLEERKYKNLYKAFLQLKTTDEVSSFCYDLMTPKELKDFADRFEVANKLIIGMSQREVSSETKVSIATVTRVNRFLNNGMNGYKLVISRLNNILNHNHPR